MSNVQYGSRASSSAASRRSAGVSSICATGCTSRGMAWHGGLTLPHFIARLREPLQLDSRCVIDAAHSSAAAHIGCPRPQTNVQSCDDRRETGMQPPQPPDCHMVAAVLQPVATVRLRASDSSSRGNRRKTCYILICVCGCGCSCGCGFGCALVCL